ncbi:AAA family ATPase [Aeromonas caviae]|uniref:AAA family ATPase n=1 Tax=Aeromonas caviae TaxID=648 RepID=UPI002B46DEAC|nr:AAA family ATPase [Aeromonas caviae]
MLKSFAVENYKAFAKKQVIDLKPITVFFGWNSGGKSALLRFLPLLSESLNNGKSPLWLEGDVGKSNPWSSFTCKATERSNISFSLSWNYPEVISKNVVEWKITGDPAGAWQQIEHLNIVSNDVLIEGAEPGFILSITPDDDCSFQSVSPSCVDNHIISESLNAIKNNLHYFSENIEWLGGIRKKTPRFIQYSGSNSKKIDVDGGNSIANLISSYQKSSSSDDLLFVKSFFSELGEELTFNNPSDGLWQVMLHPKSNPGVRVDLCDTGEGYSQVLPVLISLAKLHTSNGKIACIEQPELHLHTKAQKVLAKKIIEAVKKEDGEHNTTAIIETHSEVFLTSLQLEIARNNISHEMVRLYWIESKSDGTSDVIPIDFDENGRPNSPILFTAFQEAVDISQELISTQLSR